MKIHIKNISLRVFWAIGFIACLYYLPKYVYAQYYSQGNNGYGLVIDKKVRPINNNTFFDNIDPEFKVFSESEQIEFQITITNTGNQELDDINLNDSLPAYLNLLFYPGEYKKDKNIITDTIDRLGIGETKVYLVRGMIKNVPTTTLADKNILQINKVCAGNSLISDCDQTQYFVAARNVPSTGADDLGLKTISVLMIAILSVGLRKLARGY